MRHNLIDSIPGAAGSTSQGAATGPSFGEIACALGYGVSSGDPARARAALAAVTRTGSEALGGGVGGGFAVKPEFGQRVIDRARLRDGPFARCNWRPTRFMEFKMRAFNEYSRADGFRWGGVKASVGLSEANQMPTTNAGLAWIDFVMQRLTAVIPVTRDLLADAEMIENDLDYAVRSELRFQVDAALIGTSNTAGTPGARPAGVLNAPCSVAVTRKTAGQIAAADIDAMWSSIAGPNKLTAVWHASDEVMAAVDETAQAAGWAESIYLPQGVGGNEYPLIKGRPLIFNENCPTLGQSGDLICADWSDYYVYYHRMSPGDSGLSFSVAPPSDAGQSGWGAWGLPDGAVESRVSGEFYFRNDIVLFMFKMRLDGNWNWPAPVVNANGATVGPCCYLHA